MISAIEHDVTRSLLLEIFLLPPEDCKRSEPRALEARAPQSEKNCEAFDFAHPKGLQSLDCFIAAIEHDVTRSLLLDIFLLPPEDGRRC